MAIRTLLPRSTPEAQGVSSSAILAFVRDVEQTLPELHSLMLVRHGQVIAEGWWGPYAPQHRHELYSLSKSFTSTAVGLAMEEGRLSVDDHVLSFFPEEASGAPDANLQAMRVRHLLSMSTGHDQDASARTFSQRNWVEAFLSLPVEHEPGTHFCYNTAATYMLSAILQKVTGEKLLAYLRPRLFAPLGIANATWTSCPLGINTGGFGLSVKTEDIVRFGLLYLNKGVWAGKRLLSEGWIAEATRTQVSNGDNPDSDWAQGYGYQFWRCRHHAYRGDGAFGQYCVVMPEQDAVLAITAGLNDSQGVLTRFWVHLLPEMGTAPRVARPPAHSELSSYLSHRRFDLPVGEVTSPKAVQVSGRRIALAPNELHVHWAQFDFTADQVTYTVAIGRRTHVITCGLGAWAHGTCTLLQYLGKQKVAAAGVWTTPDTFQSVLRFYETPFYQTISCRFTEDGAILHDTINVNFGPTDMPVLEGRFV